VIELGLNCGDALELQIDQLLHVADRCFDGRQLIRARRVVVCSVAKFARRPLTLHARDYREEGGQLSRGTKAEVALTATSHGRTMTALGRARAVTIQTVLTGVDWRRVH